MHIIPFDKRRIVPKAILFTPEELRQILSIYSMGVLTKNWRDYALDTMPNQSIFSVIEHAGETQTHIISSFSKIAGSGKKKDFSYLVYADQRPIYKGVSFLQALDFWKDLDQQ